MNSYTLENNEKITSIRQKTPSLSQAQKYYTSSKLPVAKNAKLLGGKV